MFEDLTRSQQGDLGEARAIYELTRLGFVISKPLAVHIPYDLIADKDGQLYRIQVKTTRMRNRKEGASTSYQVSLCTSGGNTKVHTRKLFDPTLCDYVFVMTTDDRCWLIPTSELGRMSCVSVGTSSESRYDQYQIAGWVAKKDVVDVKPKIRVSQAGTDRKIPPFTADELRAKVWEMPTTKVAQLYGLSDNGLSRWLKKWGINKPPRGYWAKIYSEQKSVDVKKYSK